MDKGRGGLENWTVFMDDICVSSLIEIEITLNEVKSNLKISTPADFTVFKEFKQLTVCVCVTKGAWSCGQGKEPHFSAVIT